MRNPEPDGVSESFVAISKVVAAQHACDHSAKVFSVLAERVAMSEDELRFLVACGLLEDADTRSAALSILGVLGCGGSALVNEYARAMISGLE